MKEAIIQFSISLFLSVLAADILYLYSAGGWTDPNKGILVGELIMLWFLLIGGLGNAIRCAIQIKKLGG